jgi:hypothetical protein
MYCLSNSKIIDTKVLHYQDTMKIVGELMIMGNQNHTENYVVDSIGLGKGIADRLRELGKNVRAFNSAEKAIDTARFRNQKAEAWFMVAQQIKDMEAEYPEDSELRRQLSSVKYDLPDSSGKIKLVDKKKTKETLGCSPDRADAYVMGLYCIGYFEPCGDIKGVHSSAVTVPSFVRGFAGAY